MADAARKQVPPSGPLSAEEVKDERDTSPRAPRASTSGPRLRAIPAKGGTTVLVRRRDFKAHGVDHGDVKFDFRKDNFSLAVGKDKGISKEAADFLSEQFPESFEYLDQGDEGDE